MAGGRFGARFTGMLLFVAVLNLVVRGKLPSLILSRSKTYDTPYAMQQNVTIHIANTYVVKNLNSSSLSNTGEVGFPVEYSDARKDLDHPFPQVAWLMSFPNSGTTYTMHTIQEYTRTTTATNYGQEQSTFEPTIPVDPESIEGPFYRYPTWQRPVKYILTKTHCGGYCDSCRSPKEWVETPESFEVACRSGKRIVNKTTSVLVTYSADVPRRAVHLIRNPFDNIVSRLHLRLRRWARSEDPARHDRLTAFNATRDGFREYCARQDQRDFKNERLYRFFDDELRHAARQLPCHTDFIRYTWWHNNAVEVTKRKSIPVLTLYYEDYSEHWEDNINRLFHFLSLSPAEGSEPPEFIPGKEYMEFYNENEIRMAKVMVSKLASQESWELLSRYFSAD